MKTYSMYSTTGDKDKSGNIRMSYELHLYCINEFDLNMLGLVASQPRGYFVYVLVNEMLKSADVSVEFHSHSEKRPETITYESFKTADGRTHNVYNPKHDFIVIKNKITNKFSVLDFKDCPTSALIYQSDPDFAGALIAQYEPSFVQKHFLNPSIIQPYLFFDHVPNLTISMREEISEIHEKATDDRLFIAATIGDAECYPTKTLDGRMVGRRHVAKILAERYPNEILVWDKQVKQKENTLVPKEDYWRQAATHRWNLFLPGHPWCYREHEHWIFGLATFSFNLWHPLMIPLTLNEHYVGIEIPRDERHYTGCSMKPEEHAEILIQHFRKIKDNETLRKQVAASAKLRMELANVKAVAKTTLNKLTQMTL